MSWRVSNQYYLLRSSGDCDATRRFGTDEKSYSPQCSGVRLRHGIWMLFNVCLTAMNIFGLAYLYQHSCTTNLDMKEFSYYFIVLLPPEASQLLLLSIHSPCSGQIESILLGQTNWRNTFSFSKFIDWTRLPQFSIRCAMGWDWDNEDDCNE